MEAFSKIQRQIVIARAMQTILPLPCGCIPSIAKCRCESHCECELELELCDCVGCPCRQLDCACEYEGHDLTYEDDEGRTWVAGCKCSWMCECDAETLRKRELWTKEACDMFDARLAAFYRTVDPMNYADRPSPPYAIPVISRVVQIEFMEARQESGFALHHPHDLNPAETKSGEGCRVGPNGAARRVGAVAEPATNYRAMFRMSEVRAKRVSRG